MSSRYKLVGINTIFAKLIRDVTDEFSESDVIEWCGEALEATQSEKSYEEDVYFAIVKNHQCALPSYLHAIIQIAKNNRYTGTSNSSGLDAQNLAVEVTGAIEDLGIKSDIDFAFYNMQDGTSLSLIPKFNFSFNYHSWRQSNTYNKIYSPVRLAENSFFNSLVCMEKENFYSNYSSSQDEYSIVNGDTARFSFKDGLVAIAYLRQPLDKETGYPMIPDHYSYKTAIVKYIALKMMERQCYNGREGACGKADKLEAAWQFYCKQAGNVDLMPYGVDEHQNLLDQRSYMLPRNNRYYSFFGNLAKPEDRIWNNPDRRTSRFNR